jgi:hypothetical protein
MDELSKTAAILINFAITMGGLLGIFAIYKVADLISRKYIFPELYKADEPEQLPPPERSEWQLNEGSEEKG